MSKIRRRLFAGLVAILAVAVAAVGFVYVAVSSPVILIGAAPTRLAVASNRATTAVPDPPEASAVATAPIHAGACLDRITRGGGWMDLCWSVNRMMNEADAQKDYYVVQVTGTINGNPFPLGLRWAAIRARPDPAGVAFEDVNDWPGSAAFDGPCRDTPAELNGPSGVATVTVCGHTTGSFDAGLHGATGVDWTCAGCLLPLSGTQPIVMSDFVSVPEGKTPIWDIYADIGS